LDQTYDLDTHYLTLAISRLSCELKVALFLSFHCLNCDRTLCQTRRDSIKPTSIQAESRMN